LRFWPLRLLSQAEAKVEAGLVETAGWIIPRRLGPTVERTPVVAAVVQANPARLVGLVTVEVAAQAVTVARRQERMAGPEPTPLLAVVVAAVARMATTAPICRRGLSPVAQVAPAVRRQAVAAAVELVAATARICSVPST
jgi:hypothetical protein